MDFRVSFQLVTHAKVTHLLSLSLFLHATKERHQNSLRRGLALVAKSAGGVLPLSSHNILLRLTKQAAELMGNSGEVQTMVHVFF